MREFMETHILRPFRGRWWKGFLLLALWTVAFVAMPALSGWFLAISSVVFITANRTFAYLIPSSIIRLLSLLRTATRYFERLENHKTTLSVQQSLQLKIFSSVARLPYFRKQWQQLVAPGEQYPRHRPDTEPHPAVAAAFCSVDSDNCRLYPLRGALLSGDCARISDLVGCPVVSGTSVHLPQEQAVAPAAEIIREEMHQTLIQSFRGRIEISKYNLEEKAIDRHEQMRQQLERLENKIQFNSFYLQLIAGLGFSYIAAFLLCIRANSGWMHPCHWHLLWHHGPGRAGRDAFLGEIGKECGGRSDTGYKIDYR